MPFEKIIFSRQRIVFKNSDFNKTRKNKIEVNYEKIFTWFSVRVFYRIDFMANDLNRDIPPAWVLNEGWIFLMKPSPYKQLWEQDPANLMKK